eukprot:gene7186-7400_t
MRRQPFPAPVEALKQANVLLAVKTTAGGRHQNLTQ